MNFRHSETQRHWIERVSAFMAEWITPNVARYHDEQGRDPATRWRQPPLLAELQARARDAGLWNLFMPPAALAHAANGFARLFLDWRDVKRATVGAEGIHLSPFARANAPLAPFRGVRLHFAGGNAEVVEETVRRLRRESGEKTT